MNYKSLIITAIFVPLITLTDCKNKSEKSKGEISPVTDQTQSSTQGKVFSIHEAALNGQINQVLKLISEGTDVNSLDSNGRTALIYAAYNGHSEIIKKLIERGAPVNLQDVNGRTALMMASSGPYPDAVKVLLDHQADPNITDKDEHYTALMYAASEGQMDVVKILLSYGADPSLKDIDGDDAMTFAADNGHNEIAVLLQSFKNK
jgi:ankyrin repeat protein